MAAAAVVASPAQAAERFFGVTEENRLISFNSDSPESIRSGATITGLQAGERIVGIDRRPADSRVYGLGSASRLYVLDTDSGVATLVAPLSVPLRGANFGVDFNPVVDRLRVVSDVEQNLRVNPTDGATIEDASLAYRVGDSAATSNPNVAASAYSSPVAGATTTQLFGIDSGRDTLVLQDPPNAGTLNTIGALGQCSVEPIAFDIAVGDVGYAVFNECDDSLPILSRVNVATGRITRVRFPVVGNTDVEEVRGLTAAGQTPDDRSRPTVRATVRRQRRATVGRSRRLRVALRCSEGCSSTLTLLTVVVR